MYVCKILGFLTSPCTAYCVEECRRQATHKNLMVSLMMCIACIFFHSLMVSGYKKHESGC